MKRQFNKGTWRWVDKNYSEKSRETTVKFLVWNLIPGCSRKSTVCEKYWHFNTTFKAMCTVTLHHCQKRPAEIVAVFKKVINKPSLYIYSTSQRDISLDVSNIRFTSNYHNTFMKIIWCKSLGPICLAILFCFLSIWLNSKSRFCPVIGYISKFKESVHWRRFFV